MRKRYKESQERPHFLEEFGKSLQQIKKAIDMYHQNNERYNHLEKADIDKVIKCVEDKHRWFEEKNYLINKMKPTDDPVILASQIKDEKDVSFYLVFQFTLTRKLVFKILNYFFYRKFSRWIKHVGRY